MPEGDSLVRVAHRLRPVLEGRVLTHADLRVPRHATADLTGWTVAEVLPRAKYLLMRLTPPTARPGARPLTLISHLKMEGRWLVSAIDARWGAPAWQVRAVLETAEHRVLGAQLGLLTLVPTADEAIAASTAPVTVRRSIPLGPDLSDSRSPSVDDWVREPAGPLPDVRVADDDVIRIMYTSGTESRPKGAMHTSRTLMWQYMSCVVAGGMSDDDIEVHSLPLYHCAQLDNFLITDIMLGATSIILDRPDAATLLRTVAQEGATKLLCPPTVWISLLSSPDFDPDALSSLRKGYYGASALPVEVLGELTAALPGLRLRNFYGQTEMGSLAAVLAPDDQATRGGSAGRPALNVETRIVDSDGRTVPAGTVGEIVHRSPQVTVGYLNLPEKTAESFRGGWFHSGDLGYFDGDGYLWVVDRQKDMRKTGGENVSSREVEEVLFEHPAVQEAAVIGVPHPYWVEAVAAVVVPAAGYTIDPDSITRHCRDRLAPYKIPKIVIASESLPKNPSGKILKRDLRDHYADIASGEG